MGLGRQPPARGSVRESRALRWQPSASRRGAGRAAYLAAPRAGAAGAEGRVSGLGTVRGRRGGAWGRGAGPRRYPPGACSAPAPRGRAQPVGRSLGVQFLHLPAAHIEGTSSLASCACSNVCALPRHRWRERFRGGCFAPSAYRNGASRFPSTRRWSPCEANPGHLFPPRLERKRAVFCQGPMEVYKINSQSPSGNLFSHAEKIRNGLKERPSRV